MRAVARRTSPTQLNSRTRASPAIAGGSGRSPAAHYAGAAGKAIARFREAGQEVNSFVLIIAYGGMAAAKLGTSSAANRLNSGCLGKGLALWGAFHRECALRSEKLQNYALSPHPSQGTVASEGIPVGKYLAATLGCRLGIGSMCPPNPYQAGSLGSSRHPPTSGSRALPSGKHSRAHKKKRPASEFGRAASKHLWPLPECRAPVREF